MSARVFTLAYADDPLVTSSALYARITMQDFGGVTVRVAALRAEMAALPNAPVLHKRVAEVISVSMAVHASPSPSTGSQPLCCVVSE